MLVEFSHKQYAVFASCMCVMHDFYENDFHAICDAVSFAYGSSEEDAEKAYLILTNSQLTAPANPLADWANKLLEAVRNAKDISDRPNSAPYEMCLDLEKNEWEITAQILDTYSRIFMGQFSVIFEALDINPNCFAKDSHMLQAYHDARWYGTGVIEARDLLIPQLAELRIGWNGNFGIANPDNAFESKLSYEMLKTIEYALGKGDGYFLKVTDEPLLKVSGIKSPRPL